MMVKRWFVACHAAMMLAVAAGSLRHSMMYEPTHSCQRDFDAFDGFDVDLSIYPGYAVRVRYEAMGPMCRLIIFEYVVQQDGVLYPFRLAVDTYGFDENETIRKMVIAYAVALGHFSPQELGVASQFDLVNATPMSSMCNCWNSVGYVCVSNDDDVADHETIKRNVLQAMLMVHAEKDTCVDRGSTENANYEKFVRKFAAAEASVTGNVIVSGI